MLSLYKIVIHISDEDNENLKFPKKSQQKLNIIHSTRHSNQVNKSSKEKNGYTTYKIKTTATKLLTNFNL